MRCGRPAPLPRSKEDNVRERILKPIIKRADELLAELDLPPLPERLTLHKLRHTNCSLRLVLRHDPAVVAEQLGHAHSAITYSVYTHAMRVDEAEREALAALAGGTDWAPMGTSSDSRPAPLSLNGHAGHEKTRDLQAR
jgi:integrase